MGRYTHGFLMIFLGVIVVRDCQAQTASGSATDPASRLRPASTFVAGVIEEGACRSATLRSMVATLQTTDLIVYVTMVPLSDRPRRPRVFSIWARRQPTAFCESCCASRSTASRGWPCWDTSYSTRLKWRARRRFEARRPWRTTIALTACPGATESTYETDAAHRTEFRVREEVTARFTTCGGVQHARN